MNIQEKFEQYKKKNKMVGLYLISDNGQEKRYPKLGEIGEVGEDFVEIINTKMEDRPSRNYKFSAIENFFVFT